MPLIIDRWQNEGIVLKDGRGIEIARVFLHCTRGIGRAKFRVEAPKHIQIERIGLDGKEERPGK
jgi:sRNA-binding carbon storage regulator CsrA